MYELDPAAEMRVPDSLFRVSNKASYGLYKHVLAQNAQYERVRGDLYEELKENDEIPVALGEMAASLAISYDNELDFADGAAVAYRLLSFEAEITREDLPSIKWNSIEGFANQAEAHWQDYEEYCVDRTTNLLKDNREFIDALHECIVADEVVRTPDQWEAFLVGGIAMYDLLWHQAAFDRLQYYSETSVN